MNIIVLLKMVPDVVEELTIAGDGVTLDEEWLRLKVSESDEHALEEAIILKERYGGTVTVAALEAAELDDALFTAIAKGADRVVKIVGDWKNYGSPSISKLFSNFLSTEGYIDNQTLILTGSQAIDDLEGETIYYLAEELNLPGNSVVTGIKVDENRLTYIKEFSGGLRGEFEVPLPAVIGVQTAENPPRYVPIAKIRAVMKTTRIDEIEMPLGDLSKGITINKLLEPEVSGRAEMLEGSSVEISTRIVDILSEKGIF
ncbi:MAG: hypothetical protein V1779_11895 [bacterium]